MKLWTTKEIGIKVSVLRNVSVVFEMSSSGSRDNDVMCRQYIP